MRGLVVDTSAWIDFFAGRESEILEDALARGQVIVPPLVVAELISGAHRSPQRKALVELAAELPVHATPLEHWIGVGDLRRALRERGLSVSTPDAHVARCALDLGAPLLSRDRIFGHIAAHSGLKLMPLDR